MKNKKGFTLVELLAVIAILAILVIMALPAVLRMFTQARVDTFNNELNTLVRTTRQQYLLSGGQAATYSKESNPLSLTGNSALDYCITINGQGQITELKATNGSYKYESNGIVSETSSSDIEDAESGYELSCSGGSSSSATNIATCVTEGCTKTAVGTELTVGGENFYVVSSDENETVLLAKYDLKQDVNSYTQDTSGSNSKIFIAKILDSNNIAYWDGCKMKTAYSCTSSPSGLISPYSDSGEAYCTSVESTPTNCAYIYDENAVNIYPVVNSYASKIGTSVGTPVTGRLMSLEEAHSLSTNVRKDRNGSMYWLGSAYNSYTIWFVDGIGGINYYSAAITGGRPIRPVIIVSTSAL